MKSRCAALWASLLLAAAGGPASAQVSASARSSSASGTKGPAVIVAPLGDFSSSMRVGPVSLDSRSGLATFSGPAVRTRGLDAGAETAPRLPGSVVAPELSAPAASAASWTLQPAAAAQGPRQDGRPQAAPGEGLPALSRVALSVEAKASAVAAELGRTAAGDASAEGWRVLGGRLMGILSGGGSGAGESAAVSGYERGLGRVWPPGPPLAGPARRARSESSDEGAVPGPAKASGRPSSSLGLRMAEVLGTRGVAADVVKDGVELIALKVYKQSLKLFVLGVPGQGLPGLAAAAAGGLAAGPQFAAAAVAHEAGWERFDYAELRDAVVAPAPAPASAGVFLAPEAEAFAFLQLAGQSAAEDGPATGGPSAAWAAAPTKGRRVPPGIPLAASLLSVLGLGLALRSRVFA